MLINKKSINSIGKDCANMQLFVSYCSDHGVNKKCKKVVRKMFSFNNWVKKERLKIKKHSSTRNILSTDPTHYEGKSTSEKGSHIVDHLTFDRSNDIKMSRRESSTIKPVLTYQIDHFSFELF